MNMREIRIQREVLERATARYVILFRKNDRNPWEKGYLTLVRREAHLWDAFNKIINQPTVVSDTDLNRIQTFQMLLINRTNVQVIRQIEIYSMKQIFPTDQTQNSSCHNVSPTLKMERIERPHQFIEVIMPEPLKIVDIKPASVHTLYIIEWTETKDLVGVTRDQLYCHPYGRRVYKERRVSRSFNIITQPSSPIEQVRNHSPPRSMMRPKIEHHDKQSQPNLSNDCQPPRKKPRPPSPHVDKRVPKTSETLQPLSGQSNDSKLSKYIIEQMTIDDVYNMIKNHASEKYAPIFKEHEIDGPALNLLTIDIMSKNMGIAIGPVVKIHELILILKRKPKN